MVEGLWWFKAEEMGRRWRMKEKLPWVAGRWWWFTVGIRRLMKLAEVDELKAVTRGFFQCYFGRETAILCWVEAIFSFCAESRNKD